VNVHINESNKNYSYCDSCEYKTFSKVNITSHVKNHLMIELRRNYHCTICAATFTSRCNRQTHEKIMHSEVRKTFKCECGREFTTQSGLYGHKKKMHEPWNHSCSQCGKVFPTTSKLRHHKIYVHDPKRPCETCGELVPPGMFYNRHLKSHDVVKCTYEGCEKTFSKFSLQRHVTTVHLPRKESACPTCNAVFNSEHYLKIHIYRVHSEHRKQCQVENCEFSTTVRSILLKHYSKHQGISELKRDQFMQQIMETKYKRKNCDWKEKSE
jgi:Zinc finger, C2H2 type